MSPKGNCLNKAYHENKNKNEQTPEICYILFTDLIYKNDLTEYLDSNDSGIRITTANF